MAINVIFQQDFDVIARRLPPSIGRMSGKIVLVTGCRGLIGNYLCHLLAYLNDVVFSLEKPCTVVGIDNNVAPGGSPMPDSVFFGFFSEDVAEYIPARADFILHAASIASPKFYKKYPVETCDANVRGTWNLLEYATSTVESMVYFSSSEVYGDPTVIPTPETYVGALPTVGPRSCYDISKAMGETLCHVYHEQHKVPVKIIRPSNCYGPGHNLSDGRIIPQIMKSAIRQEPLKIYGDGEATRSFCYLSDAATQILWVLLEGEDGEVYNVGDQRREISMRSLAEMVRLYLPVPSVERIHEPNAMQDAPTRRLPDMRKMHNELGAPRAETELSNGLWKTFEWHKEREH